MKSERPKHLRWFIPVSIVLLLFGYFSGLWWPGQFAHFINPFIEQLRDLAATTKAHNSVILTILMIFVHNVIASVMLILLGLFAGIYPAIAMWVNGLVMGYITAVGVQSLHVAGWKIVVYALMPHGVFEMAAIVWSAAIGIHLGFTAMYSVGRRLMPRAVESRADDSTRSRLSLRVELKRTLYRFPLIAALLLLAACIEGGVTPHLIQWGMHV